MATPIKSVPVLSGEMALNFENEAEKNALNNKRSLSLNEKKIVKSVIERSKNFKLPWEK